MPKTKNQEQQRQNQQITSWLQVKQTLLILSMNSSKKSRRKIQ